jgi:hypothetical protein
MVTFGTAIADRIDEVEASTGGLQGKVDDLERRVRRLEMGEEKPS